MSERHFEQVGDIIVAQDTKELLAAAPHVWAGEVLAAVTHEAFAQSQLVELPRQNQAYDVYNQGVRDPNDRIDYRAFRQTPVTRMARRHLLPTINASVSPRSTDKQVLPPHIAHLLRDMHTATYGEQIAMPTYHCDEMRGTSTTDFPPHIDPPTVSRRGLNTWILGAGTATLRVAAITPTAALSIARQNLGKNWESPEAAGKFKGTVQEVSMGVGSIAIFRAFAEPPNPERRIPHQLETTSDFRSAVVIDWLRKAAQPIDPTSRQHLVELGVPLYQYPGYENFDPNRQRTAA